MSSEKALVQSSLVYAHFALVISRADSELRPQEGRALARGMNAFLDRHDASAVVRAAIPEVLRRASESMARALEDGTLDQRTVGLLELGKMMPADVRHSMIASLTAVAESDGAVAEQEAEILAQIREAWGSDTDFEFDDLEIVTTEPVTAEPAPIPEAWGSDADFEFDDLEVVTTEPVTAEPATKKSSPSFDPSKFGMSKGGASNSAASDAASSSPSASDSVSGTGGIAWGDTCYRCGQDLEVSGDPDSCAWCRPGPGAGVELGGGWRFQRPAMWREDSERCASMTMGGRVTARYFEAGESRFGLYVFIEGEPMLMSSMALQEDIAHKRAALSGMQVIRTADEEVGGLDARVIDTLDPRNGHFVSTALVPEGTGITRFSFHDYVSEGVSPSLEAKDAIFGCLTKEGAAPESSTNKGGAAGVSKPSGSGKAGVVPPGSAKPRGESLQAVDDGVTEEEVQETVFMIVMNKILQVPGIGRSIVETLVQEGGTYQGLHDLLGGGVSAVKKCKGIGPKKAEAIVVAYRSLGNQALMERGTREYLAKKKRRARLKKKIVFGFWGLVILLVLLSLIR